MRYIFIIALLVLGNKSIFSQNNKLLSGPVQGHITSTTAKICLIVKETKMVALLLSNKGNTSLNKTISINTDTVNVIEKAFPIVVEFNNLLPDTDYELSVQLDNKNTERVFHLKTLKQAPVADFSFITGSCALQISKAFNLITYFGSDRIFKPMSVMPADFMLWLGDYTYYLKRKFRHSEYGSIEGMWKRQLKTRKTKQFNLFMTSCPQYAIWDDHDYGSYDADSSFALKDTSLFLYKQLWANPSYGLPNLKGIFTSFRKYDSEFFLLDDRFYRTAPNIKNGTMLGKQQLKWLFESLKKSDATFKFIIMGSQFLNPCSTDECYNEFPEEKKEIYDFLENNKIPGVIFISGDSHYSDLQKEQRKNAYPLYDFTCSPLSSFLDRPTALEKVNTNRIPGTLTHRHAFGKVSVNGPIGKRVCSIELYDAKAKQLWKHEIPEEELR